ncbi:hypothetical protein [Microbacterium sp.]|uniref:hypothetical protein n=1 Tax=Microbacterium sp. TaxID=51671 RepID=UPI002810E571|nr:hypothetical protein [Microbacterium sp.]
MTTDTTENAPEAPDTDSDAPEGTETPETPADEQPDPADDTPDDLRAARHEAATRRKELRAVQAERDTLHGTVATLQRQLTEQLIANTDALPWMHRPADLFEIGGVDVADLTDDAGNIDPSKLADALTTLQGERPYLFGTRPVTGYPLFEAMSRQSMPQPPASTDPGAAWQKAPQNPS